MKKTVFKLTSVLLVMAMLVGCTSKEKVEAVVEEFDVSHIVDGTTYTGSYTDVYHFVGKTTDGIITELDFDILRTMGDKTYSKKGLEAYLMNVSDAEVVVADTTSVKVTANGYDTAYGEGAGAQFMVTAMLENATPESTFKEMTITDFSGNAITDEQALVAFGYVAKESGVENLTVETLVSDLIGAHGLFADGAFVGGKQRVSFAGFNGGRSYGEQIDAIVTYILNSKMTLEDVNNLFLTENQSTSNVADRDLVTGATITFTEEFQKMAALAAFGEVVAEVTATPEEAVELVTEGTVTKATVKTQGYGGELTTVVSFDADKKVVAIEVLDSKETDGIGAVLTAADSDYIKALIAAANAKEKTAVDAVSGATVTSGALATAVELAIAAVSAAQ